MWANTGCCLGSDNVPVSYGNVNCLKVKNIFRGYLNIIEIMKETCYHFVNIMGMLFCMFCKAR